MKSRGCRGGRGTSKETKADGGIDEVRGIAAGWHGMELKEKSHADENWYRLTRFHIRSDFMHCLFALKRQ